MKAGEEYCLGLVLRRCRELHWASFLVPLGVVWSPVSVPPPQQMLAFWSCVRGLTSWHPPAPPCALPCSSPTGPEPFVSEFKFFPCSTRSIYGHSQLTSSLLPVKFRVRQSTSILSYRYSCFVSKFLISRASEVTWRG